MKNIFFLATLIFAIFLTSSFETATPPPTPSWEMYGFLKESNSFKQTLKGVVDDYCQSKVNGINPSTTDPTEIARLKFAKFCLQDGVNSKAFTFVISELVNANYLPNLNDFQQCKDDFANSFDVQFDNLSLRFTLN